MRKHTPGPWTIDTSIRTAINAGPKHIAMVSFYKCGKPDVDVYGEEHAANCHLIAAGPELLEALEMALEWIDAVPQETPLPAMHGFNRDWVNDVIAKATAKGK